MKNVFKISDVDINGNSFNMPVEMQLFIEKVTGLSLGADSSVLAYEYARHLCPGDEPLKMSEFELCNAYARITTDIESDIMDVVCGGVSEIVVFLPLRTEMPEDCHSPNRETGYFPLVNSDITNVRAIVYDNIYPLLSKGVNVKAVIDATGMEHAKELRGFYYIFVKEKDNEDVIFARMKGEMVPDSIEEIKNVTYGADNGIMFTIAYDTVANLDFPLDPLYYMISWFHEDRKEDNLRLKDIVRLINPTDFDINATCYTLGDFKSELSDVLWGKKEITNKKHNPSEFVTFESSHPLLLIVDDRRTAKFLYLSNENKYSVIKEYSELKPYSLTGTYVTVRKRPMVCLEIQEDKVYPEYLVLNMMQEVNKPHMSAFNMLIYSLLGWSNVLILHDILNLSVTLSNNIIYQKSIVKTAKQKYFNEREKEMEADRKRLGIRSASSGLAHLLGTTFSRQEGLIYSLRKALNNGTNLDKDKVLRLIDTTRYIKRLVNNFKGELLRDDFSFRKISLCNLLDEYSREWISSMGNLFTIKLSSNNDRTLEINGDTEYIKFMLDLLFDNAYRHGFKHNDSTENEVYVSVFPTKFREDLYVVLRVTNNGIPFSDDFDLDMYKTRGRFNENTGRTGLGGNQIYQIVKNHDGFLALCKDKGQTGFDIILPLKNKCNIKNINKYDKETI